MIPLKTNTLEVSSAGGFGRGGNITVDGGDNNDEVVGGTLANFPQDSIQEFQIATGRLRLKSAVPGTASSISSPSPAATTITAPASCSSATDFSRGCPPRLTGVSPRRLSAKNNLMARYSFNRSTDVAPASLAQASPNISASERQDSLNRFHSIAAGLTTTISSAKVNNVSFRFDNLFNNLPAFSQNAPTTNPAGLAATNELLFPSIADGANFNLPQATYMNRYQLRDAYSWTLGKHALRLGGEYQRYAVHGLINVFGTGTVILTSDFGFRDLNGDGVVDDRDIPLAVEIKSSAPVSPVPIPHIANSYFAGYAQDDWRIRPNLTLNLGLRWEYDTDLLGNDSSHGPCPSLTVQPTQPCVWMANVIDLKRNIDKKNFGPRVGFAYRLEKGKP